MVNLHEVWVWGRNNGHFKLFVAPNGMPLIPVDRHGWGLYEAHAPLGSVAVARATLWGAMALAKEKQNDA